MNIAGWSWAELRGWLQLGLVAVGLAFGFSQLSAIREQQRELGEQREFERTPIVVLEPGRATVDEDGAFTVAIRNVGPGAAVIRRANGCGSDDEGPKSYLADGLTLGPGERGELVLRPVSAVPDDMADVPQAAGPVDLALSFTYEDVFGRPVGSVAGLLADGSAGLAVQPVPTFVFPAPDPSLLLDADERREAELARCDWFNALFR